MSPSNPKVYVVKLVSGDDYKTFFYRSLDFAGIMNLVPMLMNENPGYEVTVICTFDEWKQDES
jgi:hypothetical protein